MRRAARIGAVAACLIGWAPLAAAQTPTVVVVAPTPLGGPGVDPDKLPAVAQTLSSGDFTRADSLAVTDALEQRVAGLSLSDTQGNGFTRDVNFRGFEASPLQGTPQGLAVYMNGVRLNETFGDTVNWDLVPQAAIARATVFTSNPVFGLNALGGAVSLSMKTGATAPGGGLSLQGGSFGAAYGSAQYGVSRGPWSAYGAVDGGREDGWRLHSPSSVARAYGDLGWKRGGTELHWLVSGAANQFGVVGPTPVDLLSQDRRAVYTWPQTTRNRSGLAAFNGRFEVSRTWSVQANLYVRKFDQWHVDGNGGNFEGCGRNAANPLFGTLCVEDDDFPAAVRPPAAAFQVLDASGVPVGCPPLVAGQTKLCNGIPYGTLDRTRTDALTFGGSAQISGDGPLLGRGNAFAAGLSIDRGRLLFSADSTLGVIRPDLSLGPLAGLPGSGQVIHTAGAIAYSPVLMHATTTYYGVYFTDTLDLTGALSLTVSGRFNSARLTMTDLSGSAPDITGSHRFDRFNPAAGLAWKVTPALTVYGGYAEANRAPTALELACGNPLKPCLLENALVSDPPLAQVVARTWEGGLRGSPRLGGGVLDWRLGLFQTDSDNDIVALASVIQGRGSYANVPRTRRRGVEVNAQYRTGRWLAYASYSYLEATYQFSGDLPSPNSPFADAGGNIHVTPGDRIGGIPAQRLKVGADWTAIPALTVGFDVVAAGDQYLVRDEANQDAKLPAYWTANLHGSYRVGRRVELFGRIDNLLDQKYATYGTYFSADSVANVSPSPLPANADPRSLSPAAPRAFLAGVRVNW